MGKASRKKKEKKLSKNHSAYPKIEYFKSAKDLRARGAIVPDDIEPIALPKDAKVYRFFNSEKYADDFCSGHVRLTTLKKCRAYEDPLQGDPEEAVHKYSSGQIRDLKGSDARKLLARFGIYPDGGEVTDVWTTGGNITSKIEDAYLLCCTSVLNPEAFKENFGEYCVEISNPSAIFELITSELEKTIGLKSSNFGVINYADRFFKGLEAEPGRIGFVKPMKYRNQNEVRFLWEPNAGHQLDFFNIENSRFSEYCKRIF